MNKILIFLTVILTLSISVFAQGTLSKTDIITDKRSEQLTWYEGNSYCVNRFYTGGTPVVKWDGAIQFVGSYIVEYNTEEYWEVVNDYACETSKVLVNKTEVSETKCTVKGTHLEPRNRTIERLTELKPAANIDLTGVALDQKSSTLTNQETVDSLVKASEVRFCFYVPRNTKGTTAHISFIALQEDKYDACQSSYVEIDDGVVLAYNLENTCDNVVNPSGPYNLIETGTITYNEGKLGYGANFSRGNYCGKDTTFTGMSTSNNPWSINFWVKPSGFPDGSINGGDGSFFQIGAVESAGSQLRLGMCNASLFCYNSYTEYSSSLDIGSPLDLETWYMISVVYSGSQIKYYINSNYIGAIASTLNLNPNRFQIGSSSTGIFSVNGTYDALAYWNRSLNQTEIEWLYNSNIGRQYPFSYFEPSFLNVSNLAPANGSTVNVSWQNFTGQFLASDLSANCSLFGNNTFWGEVIEATNNTPYNLSVNLSNGGYYWFWNCSANSGLNNVSETWTINYIPTTTTTTSTTTTTAGTTTTTFPVTPETSNSTDEMFAWMVPLFALIMTIATFFLVTLGNRPIVPALMSSFLWYYSSLLTVRVKHFGNFTITGSPYYISSGNPEIGDIWTAFAVIMGGITLLMVLDYLISSLKKDG